MNMKSVFKGLDLQSNVKLKLISLTTYRMFSQHLFVNEVNEISRIHDNMYFRDQVTRRDLYRFFQDL